MIKLYDNGVYLLNGTEILEDTGNVSLPVSKEEAAKNEESKAGNTEAEAKSEEAESTDADAEKEPEKTRIFYVTDEVQQSQYINMFKAQGQDAIILTHNIDSAFITYLEQKHQEVQS